MEVKRRSSLAMSRLRHRAEERLRVQKLFGKEPENRVDDKRMLHELQVHMVELEMQNEEYRDALARAEADQHFTQLYESAPVAYLTVTHDSTITSLNLSASRLLGATRAQLRGARLDTFLDEPSRAQLAGFLSDAFYRQGVTSTTVTLARASDDAAVELKIDAVADEDGLHCHIAATDITDLRRVESALRESRDDLKRAQELAHVGSWRLRTDGSHFAASEELSRIFGQSAGRPFDFESFVAAIHPNDRDRVQHKRSQLADGTSYDIEYRIVAGGEIKWLRERAVFDVSADGAISYLGTTEEITEYKNLEAKIYRLAFHDMLTGLPNRRLLGDRLDHAMAMSKRNGIHGALIIVDLDDFRQVNDCYGQDIGDMLLAEVASRLGASVRETDTVARFAGNEFVVVLAQLSADEQQSVFEADRVAEKIRLALSAPYPLRVERDDETMVVIPGCKASIGISLFCGHRTGRDRLLLSASQAVYQAKAAGGDCVFFTPIKG